MVLTKGKVMKSLFLRLVNTAPLGFLLLIPYRALVLFRGIFSTLRSSFFWLFTSREYTNFTYALTPLNRKYLARFVAETSKRPETEIEAYFQELERDESIPKAIRDSLRAEKLQNTGDGAFLPGRRLGWYGLVRALKPRLVIETGIDKGLGSLILCKALEKNEKEGKPGRYIGTDINPRAGTFLKANPSKAGKILYGDSLESLKSLNETIDLFINDSDHSSDYERREYEAIFPRLSKNGIILADNAHCSDQLLDFSKTTGRHFAFFEEKPAKHWYPGAGIGISFTETVPFQ